MAGSPFRNLALVAHVDHGKTTLVDAMLGATGVFASHETRIERVMDSSDQERERGITILAKAASVMWKGTRINLVDTPGHADFGGEVERALAMVDGVLLLVDAAEGPLPQTRYVLSKALDLHLPAVLVLNKVDRPDARPKEVIDEIYQLFFDLDASEHHIEFPIISTIARDGPVDERGGDPRGERRPLRTARRDRRAHPSPGGRQLAPLCRRSSPISTPRIIWVVWRSAGSSRELLKAGVQVALCHADLDEPPLKRKLTQLMGFEGLRRVDVEERTAGDLFVVAGFPEVEIGDTLADPENPVALPRLHVDEPVLRMTFGVNTSPLAGRDGKFLTSRQIRERLEKEVLGNVSIRIGATSSPEVTEVAGRGELQLAVLIESMRREGFELQVSRPEVILREIDGKPHEPVERAVVDVPDEHVGTVTQAVAPRKGSVLDLQTRRPRPDHRHVDRPGEGLAGLPIAAHDLHPGNGLDPSAP